MLERGAVIEHRSSRWGRWLSERRLRIAVWVAVIEGIFIVFDQIPIAAAIVLGIAVLVLYFTVGDRLKSGTAGQIAWIAAVSQAFVILVPIFLIVLGSIAVVAVVILAVVALVLLFSRRS